MRRQVTRRQPLRLWLAAGGVLTAAVLLAAAVFGRFETAGRFSGPGLSEPVRLRGLTYCNESEGYCLDYPVSWAVREETRLERDDKGRPAEVSVASLTGPDGRQIHITPQFGGRPGGGTCSMQRQQYNAGSECLRQTYLKITPAARGPACEGAKPPAVLRVYSGSPSRSRRYMVRFGAQRQHDYHSKPIVAGEEFISEGFDYDNLLLHCRRQGKDQPRFAYLRFDVEGEGDSEAYYSEPIVKESEMILLSFRFQQGTGQPATQ